MTVAGMDPQLSWSAIALRLLLTVIAALLIGYDRSEHGKAAGMRTTLLVSVAAAVAMIQVNLLLPTAGRPSDSFVMNDLMRLPLGILTGVGFIGGGAILRRDNIVVGVTTAATIWLVTVVGLCFGGGQLGLGVAATALGIFALQGLKLVESRLAQEFHARLSLVLAIEGPTESMLRQKLRDADMKIVGTRVFLNRKEGLRELVFSVKQTRKAADTETPAAIANLANEAGILKLQWNALR